MTYWSTHQFFPVAKTYNSAWLCQEAEFCKQYFGDNDPYQLLQHRAWFTGPDGVWIRLDCVDSTIATWFALKAR